MAFPMIHEVAENKARKARPRNRELVPDYLRCVCLLCNGVAQMSYGGGTRDNPVHARTCTECGFHWEVKDGCIEYSSEHFMETSSDNRTEGWWITTPPGCLTILWEKEV